MARYCVIEKDWNEHTLVRDGEDFVLRCVPRAALMKRLDAIVRPSDWITHIPLGDLAWQQEGDQYVNMRNRNAS